MNKYETRVMNLDNGNSFQYVNVNGTWLNYGKNIQKAKAREEAVRWQAEFADHNYSYRELADWQAHFEKLGKRYGLTREFKENGII